jgi:hypothetical protein
MLGISDELARFGTLVVIFSVKPFQTFLQQASALEHNQLGDRAFLSAKLASLAPTCGLPGKEDRIPARFCYLF